MNDTITRINTIFAPYGLQVDEVITGAQIIRFKIHLPLDAAIQNKVKKGMKAIEYTLSSALLTDDFTFGKELDYLYIDCKKSFDKVPFTGIIDNLPKDGLLLALGNDINGQVNYIDLAKAPHVLVAGTTGSGKSELLHTFIASLIWRRNENPCWIVLADPKRSEFSQYKNCNGIDLLTEVPDIVAYLKEACNIMERRYQELEIHGYKDISEAKDLNMDRIVFIIDELADLMLQERDVEQYIVRLAQKARACGIHLIIGTQSPRADIVTGLIKANIPTKIALKTSNPIESRIIIDRNGAESLYGKGDMLYLANGSFNPIRIQSAYVEPSDRQILSDKIREVKTTYQPQPTQTHVENYTPTTNFAQFDEPITESSPAPHPTRKKKRLGLFGTIKALWNASPYFYIEEEDK